MTRNVQMLGYGTEYGAIADEHLLMSDPKTDAAKHADLERAEAAEAQWTLPPGKLVVPCVVLRVPRHNNNKQDIYFIVESSLTHMVRARTHTHTHTHTHTYSHTHTHTHTHIRTHANTSFEFRDGDGAHATCAATTSDRHPLTARHAIESSRSNAAIPVYAHTIVCSECLFGAKAQWSARRAWSGLDARGLLV